jgi:hypothetical protein
VGVSLRHQLLRILIAQLVEREIAARGDARALGEKLRRIELREAHAQPQVALGVRLQRLPALGHRLAQPDRRQHILQRLARAQVHVHVARGNQRQSQPLQRSELRPVVGPAMQLGGDPGAIREMLRRPAGILFLLGEKEHKRLHAFHILALQEIRTLLAATTTRGDQGTDRAVGFPVGREQHHLQAVL